jgi:hypothetical protein
LFRLPGIFTKLLRAHIIYKPVVVTMACDLVTLTMDFLDEMGISLSVPTETEESGLDTR